MIKKESLDVVFRLSFSVKSMEIYGMRYIPECVIHRQGGLLRTLLSSWDCLVSVS